MAAPYVAISELKSGRAVQRIVGRLLRFWEARNVKKEGELMGIDFLLIDDKATVIQGSIHVHQLGKFQEQLKEGSIYVITAFEVTKSNPQFKLTDFHLSIHFNDATTIAVIDESICEIPKELFKFRSYEELVSLGNTNNELPDVVGEVCATKAYCNEATQSLERMLVHLCLQSGEIVKVSAFDSHATTLNRRMEKKEVGTCVMVATSINPKFFGGELYLNATSGTKFYFYAEVGATRSFVESLNHNVKDNSSPTGKYSGVQKIEHVSIAELNEFLLAANTQEGEFLCKAQVMDIQTPNGWSYISCSKCGKKLIKRESYLACQNCSTSSAVGNVRYRVEMVVNDGTTSAVFVAFDKDMVKLTNTTATSLAAQMADDNAELENTLLIPRPISKIIGNTYTFHIKLTAFNFTTHHRSFTLARIFDKPNILPKPTFAEEHGTFTPEICDPPRGIRMPDTDTTVPTSSAEENTGDFPITTAGEVPRRRFTSNDHNVIPKKPKLN